VVADVRAGINLDVGRDSGGKADVRRMADADVSVLHLRTEVADYFGERFVNVADRDERNARRLKALRHDDRRRLRAAELWNELGAVGQSDLAGTGRCDGCGPGGFASTSIAPRA